MKIALVFAVISAFALTACSKPADPLEEYAPKYTMQQAGILSDTPPVREAVPQPVSEATLVSRAGSCEIYRVLVTDELGASRAIFVVKSKHTYEVCSITKG